MEQVTYWHSSTSGTTVPVPSTFRSQPKERLTDGCYPTSKKAGSINISTPKRKFHSGGRTWYSDIVVLCMWRLISAFKATNAKAGQTSSFSYIIRCFMVSKPCQNCLRSSLCQCSKLCCFHSVNGPLNTSRIAEAGIIRVYSLV